MSKTLPPSITVPFLQVANHLELPPVGTYAALNLWNFTTPTGSSFDDLDTLKSLHTFTGTEDESWFYLVSVAMECRGASIIPTMLYALEAVRVLDYNTIVSALEEMSACIRMVGALLDRMHEKCDPMVFYHEIRPFLAGSKNMEAAGLPNGVFYDGGDGKGQWRQLRGGSNGQSSLIQFFDIVLGVEHTSSGNSSPHQVKSTPHSGESVTKEPSFHREVRGYMPGSHHRFLEHVARMGSIRDLAMQQPATTPQQELLRDTFQAATRTLAEFRNKHLNIVVRYIVLPSKQPYKGGRLRHLASASSKLSAAQDGPKENPELTGTGGTTLLPFLKQARDETYKAGEVNQDARP